MALDANIRGYSSQNGAEVDANNNLLVNLPTTASQAGYARLTYSPASGINKDVEVTEEGKLAVAQSYQLLSLQFNSAATNWANQIGTNATTMTKSPTAGYMRLNGGAITTTTTGISIYSNRTVNLEEAVQLRIRMYAKHTNATATNKVAELGLGYYNFAAGQANAPNEFIGFRWTSTGGLIAVVETSQGAGALSQTINVNANVPFADNVTKGYEMCLTEHWAEFYTDGTYQGRIARQSASWSLLKGVSLPWMARLYNSGTASAAMTFDIGMVDVQRYSMDSPGAPFLKALQGRSSYYFQGDIGGSAATHNMPASGTAPTAAAGSNTASALNNTAQLGGWYRNTLTGVSGTAHTNVLVAAFQNPAVPTASGVAQNSRNLVVTGIQISPMVVTTALTGGGFTALWFAAVGATATSLATADADGTTAVAQKAPRLVPLNLMSTLAAAAAVGVVSTDVGDHQFVFPSPLVIHPGEFLHVGFRTIVATAITAGAADGAIGVNGYWE